MRKQENRHIQGNDEISNHPNPSHPDQRQNDENAFDWSWESEEEQRRMEELFGDDSVSYLEHASNRTKEGARSQKRGAKAAAPKKKRVRRKHHFVRRFLIALIALAAGLYGGWRIYQWMPDTPVGRAQLSKKQIEEMVRKRLMNQTSKNLVRIPVFAHRGFVEDSLENTFAAFDLALLSGCPQIELDVRTSSDGVLYVCHDETLNHIAGLDWTLSDHTSEELDQVVMKNGEKLHRLSEVIGRYRDQLIYLIEFKEDGTDPQPFVDVVEQYPQYASTMQIQSFYPSILEAIHEKLPNMFVQLLINEYTEIDKALSYPWLDSLALDEKLVSEKRIAQVHEAGKEIWLWTVDNPDHIRRYLSWGADGVITDMDSAVTIYREMAQANQEQTGS